MTRPPLRLREPATIVLALTVLAAALRFATLDVQSIWLDESATLILVRRGLWGMLSHLSASESAPPLYYALAWFWTQALWRGRDRLPLALSTRRDAHGTGALPGGATDLHPRGAVGRGTGGGQSRDVLLLAGGSRLRAADPPERRRIRALAALAWSAATAVRCGSGPAMSALALLTHYFAVFLFIPEALLLARRRGWRAMRAPARRGCARRPGADAPRAGRARRRQVQLDRRSLTALARRGVGQAVPRRTLRTRCRSRRRR